MPNEEKTLEQLQEELKAANDKNAQLEEENKSLKAEIKKLLETPDEKEKADGVGKAFTYEKKKYAILVPAVRIPGIGRRTALEILTDKVAQKWLVEKKSGVIQEQV